MSFPFLEQVKLQITRRLAQIQRCWMQFAMPILLGVLLGAIAGLPWGNLGKIGGGIVGGGVNGYLAGKKRPQAQIASLSLSALVGTLNGFLVATVYWASVCRYLPNWPPLAGLPYRWGIGAISLVLLLTAVYTWAQQGKSWQWFSGLGGGFLWVGVCFFLPIPSSLGLILLIVLLNLLLNEWLSSAKGRKKTWLAQQGVVLFRRLALGFLVLQLGIIWSPVYGQFWHPLVRAAAAGDLPQVEELRQTTPDRQVSGLALLQAIDQQKLAVAKLLLKSGAGLNSRNFYGDTPLSLAIFAAGLSKKAVCQPNWENLAIDLIKAGAEVNVRGGFLGNSPLMQAAKNECNKLVNTLIQARADANARNDMGETALWRTNNEIRKLLIAAGTDLNAMSYSLPLHGRHGRTALMHAIANYADNPTNTLSTAKFLIQAAADVTAQNAEGETALSLAGPTKNAELIQMLKRSGAKP